MIKTITQVKIYNVAMLMVKTISHSNLSLDVPLHGLHLPERAHTKVPEISFKKQDGKSASVRKVKENSSILGIIFFYLY